LFFHGSSDAGSLSQAGGLGVGFRMTAPAPEIIDLDVQKLEALLRRAEEGAFAQEDYSTIRTVLESYFYLTNLIDQKSTTIARLRKLMFGAQTEKTSAVLGQETSPTGSNDNSEPASPSEPSTPQTGSDKSGGEPPPAGTSAQTQQPSSRPKGHGRNGAEDYPGAQRVNVPHESLQAGDACPQCLKGTVYANPAGVLIRFTGRSPVQATIYALQKFRCHLCGKVFTAQPPEGVGSDKYDATVVSMIGLLKYGTGVPFHRLDTLQENLQVPLPASTQWEIVCGAIEQFTPVHQELIRQAAGGEVLHNDDTTVKILELMVTRARAEALAESAEPADGQVDPARTGLFTSGIVATRGGERIALFFSGRRHAGENLQEVLRRRATDLPPPIQMCDALSRNTPPALQTIVANCLAHARRQFVDVYERFPAECGHVLEVFQVVYRNEALACERGLASAERLAFHQAQSGPVLEQLRAWLKRQFDERLVEPNSGLGAAINYLRKHWEKLTLFLRVPGAPLDNNLCERALKKAILHRKNALFYKTRNGAAVGDLYMSLIYTCELCGANPFEYLTELQRYADQVAAAPAHWLPWNYREMLSVAGAAT
jgi:transposase